MSTQKITLWSRKSRIRQGLVFDVASLVIRLGLVAVLIWLAWISFFSSDAHAWTRNPLGGKWPGDPAVVPYFANMSMGTHAQDELECVNGGTQWTTSGADFQYSFQGWNSDLTYRTQNTTNTVMSIDDGAPLDDKGNYGCFGKNYGGDAWGFALGFNIYWTNGVGQITDSFVVICEKWRKPTTGDLIPIKWAYGSDLPAKDQNEVWGTVAHEMGHMLGLGHSCDKDNSTSYPNCPTLCGQPGTLTEATMCAYQPFGTAYQRDLAADDITGIKAIYGVAPAPPPPDMDGDGILNGSDNCPIVPNPDQLDTDADHVGNICDDDDDGDRLLDQHEINVTRTDPLKWDTDSDGVNDWSEFYLTLVVIGSYESQPKPPPPGPVCGNETCESGETCSTCPSDCGNCPPVCGNGKLEGTEKCDDANLNDLDACGNDCQPNFCGDGQVNNGETCDTAGASATCDADCTAPICGDGVKNTLAGEGCDDGNKVNCDGCNSLCKKTYQCNDGCDNDRDGKIDCADNGCHPKNDMKQSCNPSDPVEYVKNCANLIYIDPDCTGIYPQGGSK